MNPSIMAQTLGAIVQALASILAIAGAFFIFVIERTRSEVFQVEDRVDENIRKLIACIRTENPNLLDEIDVREAKKQGIVWLDEQFSEVQISSARLLRIQSSEGYCALRDDIPKYQSVTQRTGTWTFKYFRHIFILCSLILISAILLLYEISARDITKAHLSLYLALVLSSCLIIGIFVFDCWELSKIYKNIR